MITTHTGIFTNGAVDNMSEQHVPLTGGNTIRFLRMVWLTKTKNELHMQLNGTPSFYELAPVEKTKQNKKRAAHTAKRRQTIFFFTNGAVEKTKANQRHRQLSYTAHRNYLRKATSTRNKQTPIAESCVRGTPPFLTNGWRG